MGYDVMSSSKSQRIVTASGIIQPPIISVERFSCFGKTVYDFEVLAYELPRDCFIDGLLGMDFLSSFDISISTKNGTVIVK